MKIVKNSVILLALILATFGHSHASPIELTKKYAFSQIRLGYLDHFHESKKQVDLMLGVPLIAFSREIQLDPFMVVRDGEGLKQAGFSLPIFVGSRAAFTPAIFRDFEAEQMGVAFTATIRVR